MIGLRALALACMVILPAAVVCDDLTRFALSAEAHRCCAATAGECAGLSTPDDCCRTQEQAASHGYTSVAADSRVRVAPASAPTPLPADFPPVRMTIEPARALDSRGAFKRPHDPPHLHPFPLLV